MRDSAPICNFCKRPIRDGNPRWSGREPEECWHYDCATAAGLTLAPKPSLGAEIAGLGPRAKNSSPGSKAAAESPARPLPIAEAPTSQKHPDRV